MLAGGILLSLAANLAQAQPTPWGRITAATPSGAFLVAVSMLERRATRAGPGPSVPAPVPVPRPVPDEDGQHDGQDGQPEPSASVPSPSGESPADPSQARPADELVAFARRVAVEHEQAHGEPITRDKLRARLGVSNQLASTLLRELRSTELSTT